MSGLGRMPEKYRMRSVGFRMISMTMPVHKRGAFPAFVKISVVTKPTVKKIPRWITAPPTARRGLNFSRGRVFISSLCSRP